MGFLSHKHRKKARHIGKKSFKVIKHIGKKVVQKGPEALVAAGQTAMDVGKFSEQLGEVAMKVNPELGEMLIAGGDTLQRGGSVVKDGGRAGKKFRKGDTKGGLKQLKKAERDYAKGVKTTSRKSKNKNIEKGPVQYEQPTQSIAPPTPTPTPTPTPSKRKTIKDYPFY